VGKAPGAAPGSGGVNASGVGDDTKAVAQMLYEGSLPPPKGKPKDLSITE